MKKEMRPSTVIRRLKSQILELQAAWRNNYWRSYVSMWWYPRTSLRSDLYNLYDLDQRVKAAEQLGHEVYLASTDAGLQVRYRLKQKL